MEYVYASRLRYVLQRAIRPRGKDQQDEGGLKGDGTRESGEKSNLIVTDVFVSILTRTKSV